MPVDREADKMGETVEGEKKSMYLIKGQKKEMPLEEPKKLDDFSEIGNHYKPLERP